MAAAAIARSAAAAPTGGFSVDLGSRQRSRAFFNAVFQAAEQVPMEFSGDVGACEAGDTSPAFKDAVLSRVNYYRAMAGVPANVTFTAAFNAKAQQAALMMASAGRLSHFPDPSWPCHSGDGAEGAGNSNLALGNAGPSAIDAYMRDDGSNNYAVGHRRWILHPPTRQMGTGDASDPVSGRDANALWVLDTQNIWRDEESRDGYVAWPPPGYVPTPVTPTRWSFSFQHADFSGTTVRLSLDGEDVPVTLEDEQQGYGLNTLVWYPSAMNPNSRGEWSDGAYLVELENVLADGEATDFSYTVRLFDPSVPGPAEALAIITGREEIDVGVAEEFSFTPVDFAESHELLTSVLVPYARVEGGEAGLANVTDGTDGTYPLLSNSVQAEGNFAFHLAHPSATPQFFELAEDFLPSPSAELSFQSRLGFATANQVARVQVSSDGGASWSDVYTQPGSGGRGETTFGERVVSLAAYSGQIIRIRFLYDFAFGSFYPQTDDGMGLYVDEIALTGMETLAGINTVDLGTAVAFEFTPESVGRHLLAVRFFGWRGFPGSEWGPAFVVEAVEEADFDGDGLADAVDEDDDNDGLPDAWETRYGMDTLDATDAAEDQDEDGLDSRQEYDAGTRPDRADTDDDGLPDGEEIADGHDPLDPGDGLRPGLDPALLLEAIRHRDSSREGR